VIDVSATVITVDSGLIDEGPTASKTVTIEDELDTGNGYIEDTTTLTTVVLTEDDENDRAELTCDDIVWTAVGGNIGPTPGAILYDDSVSGDPIIGYIDFGDELSAGDGLGFNINDITLRLT
jgi:hypothetical protein